MIIRLRMVSYKRNVGLIKLVGMLGPSGKSRDAVCFVNGELGWTASRDKAYQLDNWNGEAVLAFDAVCDDNSGESMADGCRRL